MSLHGPVVRLLEWFLENVLFPTSLRLSELVWILKRLPEFIVVLVVFYLVGRALVWTLSKTLLHSSRVDPMLSSLLQRLLFATMMIVGFTISLLVFDVNVFNLAIGLGLVGAGLALGLQNTVANVMGGISLVSDRPFEVGDRVRIGEFWGDVEEIGLRSTRILTVRREYVIVPNRLMDEREIWNYTKRYPELRIDVDVQISYDSDVSLARQLALDVADEHSSVLSFPEPRLLNEGFQDSGIQLQLRCFIADARQQYVIASDLRDRMKAAFQANGVEIPYPYRTLVDKQDLPESAVLEDADRTKDRLGPRRVLVASSGPSPAVRKAATVVEIAEELDADIVLAHISPRSSIVSEREGERAADIYEAKAGPDGPAIKLVTAEASIVEAIRRLVEAEGCGAVVIGSSPTPVLRAWKQAGIEERVRSAIDVPVVVVPEDLDVSRGEIQAARRSLNRLETGESPS